MPLADSACEAAMSALPSWAWKVLSVGVGVNSDRGDGGREGSEGIGGTGGMEIYELLVLAPNDTDRRPPARIPLIGTSPGMSREASDLTDFVREMGDVTPRTVPSHLSSSKPRPASSVRRDGAQEDRLGVEVFFDGCLEGADERPFKEPIERRTFNFFPGPPLDCGRSEVEPALALLTPFSIPRKPFEVLRIATCLSDLLSLYVRLRVEQILRRPKVLLLSNRPSKSRRSS